MTADEIIDGVAADEIERRSKADKLRRERRINEKLRNRCEDLEGQIRVFERVARSKPIKIPARRAKSKGKKVHTQVGIISDTHTCEVVEPDRVRGRNEHNTEIGSARLVELFEDTATHWKMRSKWYDIPDICLMLLGDYLVNDGLHPPDSARAVNESPLREAEIVGALLKGGIEYLAQKTQARISVACIPGNHGRIGKDKRITKQAEYSIEHFLHADIARHFADHEMVTVDASLGKFKTVEVGGLTFAVAHGDPALRGGPGLPGSFARFAGKLKGETGADLVCAGHVHQSFYSVSDGFVNGSLVGYNEYAQEFLLKNERPAQWGFLVSHEDREVGTVWRYWGD